MPLPALTPLQYLTLHLLFAGPQTGQQLREALRALGVRQSRAAFSRLMMRMVIANHVVPRASTSIVAGQNVRQNLYEITDLGVFDWTAAQKFYLNLPPPSSDLIPVATDSGELAAYDAKTQRGVIKAAVVKALKLHLRTIIEKR